jgi:hypothetical protein
MFFCCSLQDYFFHYEVFYCYGKTKGIAGFVFIGYIEVVWISKFNSVFRILGITHKKDSEKILKKYK